MKTVKKIFILLLIMSIPSLRLQAQEIHNAASSNNFSKVKELLEKGADVNEKDGRGRTALLLAAVAGHKDVAELLISHGADVNLSNDYGWTPLHFAASRGHEDVAKIIIDNKAEINIKDSNGETPLHWALRDNQSVICELLIAGGAGVTIKDNYGKTPVQMAVENGYMRIVELMLKNEKALGDKDEHSGKTLLHLAALNGHQKLCNFLISKGLKVNSMDKYGKTPLHYAAKYGHKKVADLLSESGAKADNPEENYGTSPFLKKELKEKEAVIWYLYNCGWAVKTKSRLLIFDYWDFGAPPADAYLANGRINPEEIKDLNVFVFSSHQDYDHFDKIIFDWAKTVKNITYILTWENEENDKSVFMKGGDKREFGGMEVSCINATGNYHMNTFLVKVDGLSIFHSADVSTTQGIDSDYLFRNAPEIDILFLSVFGEDFGVIEKLQPKVMFPMHSGEPQYREYAKKAEEKNFKTKVYYAENRGDRFFYNNGKIEQQ